MVPLEVTIQLNSPLFLGAQKQGNVSETLTFLPGTTLRGAMGKLLAEQCGHCPDAHSDCDFAVIFSEKIQPRFGPCYPSLSSFSYPFPATARQCKHYPGFKSKNKNETDDYHGIHDILIPLFANEEAIAHSSKNHQKIKAYRPECEICNAKLEPVSGFYESSGRAYLHPRPRIMRLSRTAINRRRNVAADQLLYTLELISEQISGLSDPNGHAHFEPTKFRGKIWAEDEAQSALLEKMLPMITHIGGATSRGLGSVAVRVEKPLRKTQPEPENAAEELANAASKLDFGLKAPSGSLTYRLALFNQALNDAFKADSDLALNHPSLYFSVDCLSDVVFPKGGLQTTLLPEKFAGARRMRSFSKPARLSGFSGATGLMRSPQLAIGRGSVFLYRLEPATPESVKSALEILYAAENQGLGQNKERGFGLVQICSPFHLEVKPI
ncbi:MAG: CRISPR-associated RAMP protein Csx10 [Methanothrix sp.]|nr:MAG: CRISPR-associated RAMP protein Csx10 [Methanothrix sp.]